MARVIRRKPGPLVILACLLILSAILRAGAQTSLAFAQVVDSAPTAPAMAAGDRPTAELLAAFQAREERLIAREGQLRDRLQALRVAEVEIAEKLQAMRLAEEALNATIARAETASVDDLDLLRAVYENMKPKEAAALFAQMPSAFAAGFLALMQAESAAAIMAELPPETAYSFSVVLAGRNANAPRD
jgi:flagellar motility protein MotE (MotC chaperone)